MSQTTLLIFLCKEQILSSKFLFSIEISPAFTEVFGAEMQPVFKLDINLSISTDVLIVLLLTALLAAFFRAELLNPNVGVYFIVLIFEYINI